MQQRCKIFFFFITMSLSIEINGVEYKCKTIGAFIIVLYCLCIVVETIITFTFGFRVDGLLNMFVFFLDWFFFSSPSLQCLFTHSPPDRFLCIVASIGCFAAGHERLNWMVKSNLRRTMFVVYTTMLLVAQGERCHTMSVALPAVFVSIPFLLVFAIGALIDIYQSKREQRLLKEQDQRTTAILFNNNDSVTTMEQQQQPHSAMQTTETTKKSDIDFA